MAKKQSFGDKLKRGKGVDKNVVKVIKGLKTESGSTKYVEEYIKVDDMNQVTKIEI